MLPFADTTRNLNLKSLIQSLVGIVNSLIHPKKEFKDTKGVIRIRKSMKDRHHNGQNKKDQQRSTKHTHKTKDQVTPTPLKIVGELRCSGRVSSFCSASDIHRVTLVAKPVISQ